MHIFISYRRDDSILGSKLLHSQVAARFGAGHVFMDIDDIGYGDDFAAAIDTRLARADVVLVVIGPRWAEMLQARLRGDDWVRHEVSRALQLRAASGRLERPRIIPVLIGGAALPSAGALPADIAALHRLNMVTLDEHALNASVNTLIEAIQRESFEAIARRLAQEEKSAKRVRMAVALVGVAMFLAGWMAAFDYFGLDTRIASATMRLAGMVSAAPPPWSGQVVLVGIDEGSKRALARNRFDASWRAEHARLITLAAAAGARAVAFDMVFEDPGPDAADAALERALAATRATMPVVFGVQQMDGPAPAMLARFATLAVPGIACAGTKLGLARSLPLAVQRAVTLAAPESVPRRDPVVVIPSLALAVFAGGGRAEPFDELAQTLEVLLRTEQRSQTLAYYAAETVRETQTDCNVIAKGDRFAGQLLDPHALPLLRSPPQRLAYEQVLAGDPAALALLKGRIVLVGMELPGQDLLSIGGAAGERWGVELIAAQIDAMTRGAAVRSIGGVAQWLLMSALALLGAALAHRLGPRPPALRAAAWLAVAAVFVSAVVGWYRLEQQLIGLLYGLVALALGALVAHKFTARKLT